MRIDALWSRIFTFFIVLSVAVLGLVAMPVAATAATPASTSSAKALPAAPEAVNPPLSCIGTIYAVNSSSTGNGVLTAINTDTGATSPVAISTGQIGDNSLGMSADGKFTYSYRNDASKRYPIVIHDVVAGTYTEIPTNLGDRTIRGAINPVNGLFYLSNAGANGTVYVFDTVNQTLVGKIGTLAPDFAPAGGNGDFAFDTSGNLYVVAGDRLYRATSTVPTTAGNATISLTTLAVLPSGTNSPAIAFASDGYLYVSSGSVVTRVDPGNGAISGTFTLPNGYSPSDFASCAAPNTLSIKKNVQGRILPTDQFGLQITGNGISSGNTATTAGTANGVQSQVAGPVLTLENRTYTVSETAAGSTSLSNYVSSYRCIDLNNSNDVVASGNGITTSFTYPRSDNPSGGNVECTFTNVAKPQSFSVKKTVDKPNAKAGDKVNYSVVLTNTGQVPYTVGNPASITDNLSNVLDDANYNNDATATPGTAPAPSYSAPTLSWSGPLAIGATVTLNYSVTVKADGSRGNNTLKNIVTGGSNCQAGSGDVNCTTTTTVPQLEDSKSVNPASGTSVVAGQELTYTLTFKNTGAAAGTVDRVDDLTKVLDDATISSAPVSSDPALTVSNGSDGKITVKGTLAAGQTVTVTYKVKVKADGSRGDNILGNFLVNPGETPPTTCVPGNPDCTTNPVTQLEDFKSVDPASGSTVVAGQELTYTLTFKNVGAAPVGVDRIDDLTKVLDDATISSAPVSSNAALVVSNGADGKITIKGTLAVGQTVTVTYKVKVKPDGSRGDNILGNFLVNPGETPPATCEPGNPDCTTNPVPQLEDSKSVNPASGSTVVAGQELTYTLTFKNTGAAAGTVDRVDDLTKVLDDAEITSAPVSSDAALTVSNGSDGKITVKGTLAAGQTVTVTYKVKVKADGSRGDNVLGNFLVNPGETPPATCEPGNPDCTTNPVPQLEDSKSVNPASGSTVVAGQELTYTLTFKNTGAAAGTVDRVDDLTKVLDDATISSAPVSSNAALVVSNGTDGKITVKGTLAAGQTVTVTYKVKVKADGSRGDNVLGNFLVNPGETPPATCEPGNPDCTTNPVPQLEDSKSVDPASGSSVSAGQELTYTLTFKNTGAAAGSVDRVDDLTKVLDDAEITSAPVSSDAALTVSNGADGKITVKGTLAAGQTVTVTYKVKVKADGSRGDNVLGNFLVNPGETPPATCEPGNPDCTTNPITQLEDFKSVDPASGSTVVAGQELTYTLTFKNVGAAPVGVDRVDDLTKVLDDATISAPPTASNAALVVSDGSDGKITVKGTLAAGQTVTVTYKVKVKADGSRGDNVLGNFLVNPGETPPATCEPGNPDCTTNPVPQLEDSKSVDPTSGSSVSAGQELTYTLTFKNTGAAAGTVDRVDDLTKVLDDATISSAPVSSDAALTVSNGSDGKITVKGTLAAGQTVTVTYKVKVKADGSRGDNVLGNFLVNPGETPPTTCEPGNPDCTTNPITQLEDFKSVDPASGSTVVAGQELTYTLTFKNVGAAPVNVDKVDDLTKVLDDADITSAPASSDAALTVSDGADGKITIKGTLAVNQTVTVTYKVKVKADGSRGDNVLGNFLVNPGETPPATCEPGNPDCTTNPVPQLEDSKSVDPASGSTVLAGQELTYTLTFKNTGAAAGTVDRVDDLSKVLDDAAISSAPVASNAALTVSDGANGKITVKGTLNAGQIVTVTYKVKVKADGSRGDNVLGNFLVNPGETPPATCEPGNPDCTTNPVPQLEDSKSVDPASGSTVLAGQELTYTLTFKNTGAAAGTVDRVDDLSKVLDDAAISSAPVASNAALTVSDGANGKITVKGTLNAGQIVTVTYKVKVKADGSRGDNVLGNFLVNPGETPPATCEPGNPDCTTNPVPQLEDSKSVDPASGSTVLAGQELTYTLTFKNTGAAAGTVDRVDDLTKVLDDATISSAPVSSDPALTVSNGSDGKITVKGTLAAGQTVTVTYKVKVKADGSRGDNVLGNFLVDPGETPPTTCEPGNPDCTTNPVPQLEDSKSVDPASGTAVSAGRELTYTLTFKNTGAAAGTVDRVDDLTKVLDDAEITSAPVSSDPALTVSDGSDGKITVKGTLAAGQTVTVTYKVKVKADGSRGDNILGNFLVNPGETPPTTCVPGNPDCTTNPVTQLEDFKSVDPASGSTVVAGQELTYTLTFKNVGAAPVGVDRVDDLSKVLDDATITSAPVASDAALTVSDGADGKITIKGTLAINQTVTVTYKVKVKADGSRGDNILGNFLVNPGETPPATCEPGNPDCTTNPVPQLEDSKSVDPASGSTVVAGQELTYTLTFKNTGAAAGTVDRVDDLTKVLDDAEITSAPASSDAVLTVSDGADGKITVKGTLAAGQTVTVTYKVKVKPNGSRGDNVLGNFLVNPGETPPTTCEPGNPDCTTNPVPEVTDSKSVNPESRSTVVAGQELTYTLTFKNTGAAIGGVDRVDDLTKVLDDASLISAPAASDPALSVTDGKNGQIVIKGDLKPGQIVTVTYKVKVKADGSRGDNVLANFLLNPGQQPPTSCEAPAPAQPGGRGLSRAAATPQPVHCTTNPVPQLQDFKSVDPASTTPVKAGQELTYTLTFKNVGAAAGTVNRVDDLSKVLDDAALISAPTSSDPALTVSDGSNGKITVKGSLAAGQTVTVTYKVKVNPDSSKGDNVLANFLLNPGDTPPAVCAPKDPHCTTNPKVPGVVPPVKPNLPNTGAEGLMPMLVTALGAFLLGILLLLGFGLRRRKN
ncbi:hypothetical protein [Psychromicrobium sp. YIM B11713]|uniref:DUF7927 domain-containing protein n=1 Tax=Psychromicrobium sp. YIM B11713 TaxID=3145233 RepID=UPI00374EE1C5